MTIKKMLFIITVLISIFVMTGCTGSTGETISISDPYLGGSQGLVVEFEPMAPESDGVQTIFDDEEFSVDVNVKNKGEYSVPPGMVTSKLKGISSSDYTGLTFESTNDQKVEKISEFNDNGGEVNIEHGSGKLVASRIQDRNLLSATVFAEITYPYKTFVSAPKVCFKDVSAKNRDDEICDVDTGLQIFSSGAPIKARSAEEDRAGKGLISVKFVIENVGGGESKDPSKDGFDYRYDEISFTVQESSEPNKWSCTSAGREGVGRFRDDKTLEINCKLNDQYRIEEDEVFQSQLDLTLEYDYRVLINNDLIIRNNDI